MANNYEHIAQLSFLFHAMTCHCRCRHCKGRGGGGQWGGNPYQQVSYWDARAATAKIYDWHEQHHYGPFKLLLGAAEATGFPGSVELMRFHVQRFGRRYLVCNGMPMMSLAEVDTFMAAMYDAGARVCMTTFYGTRDFHDAFAGREGDFDFLLQIVSAAEKYGMNKQHNLFISRSTLPYLDEVSAMLLARPGRVYLQYRPIFNKPDVMTDPAERFHKKEFPAIAAKYQLTKFFPLQTRAEWIAHLHSDDFQDPTRDLRHLTPTILLNQESMAELHSLDAEQYLDLAMEREIAKRMATPTMRELSEMYGDSATDDDLLYTLCDLEYEWKYLYQQGHPDGTLFYL